MKTKSKFELAITTADVDEEFTSYLTFHKKKGKIQVDMAVARLYGHSSASFVISKETAKQLAEFLKEIK